MSTTKQQLSNAQLAIKLSKYLSDFLNTTITFEAVLDELFLMNLGQPPVNAVLAAYIKDAIESINNL